MNDLDRIQAIKKTIAECNKAIMAIQEACQHEWQERQISTDFVSHYQTFEKVCTKCDKFGGAYTTPLKWYERYLMNGLLG